MDERIYQIALSIINGLGPVKARILLEKIGSLEGIFRERPDHLEKVEGLGKFVLSELDREKAIRRAEQEIEFIEQNGIQLHYFKDLNYPKSLKQCFDAPLVLFTLGKVNFNQRNIAIVGTRKSTAYGKKMVDELSRDLVPYKVQIVSGLAHGIDKFAHETALRNELSTLGVLGHGLDTMYPAAHRALAKQMLENGGLVTEYISGIVGDPGNFPKRNRIVAGLCEATVVVESSETGGSMITANLANDYNREVFAFPGNVDRESSKGCNNLIRRQRAHLITSAEDLADILDWKASGVIKSGAQELFIDLAPEEEKIMKLIEEKGELDIDNLSLISNMNSGELSLHLINLEMKGVVRTIPGKRYTIA